MMLPTITGHLVGVQNHDVGSIVLMCFCLASASSAALICGRRTAWLRAVVHAGTSDILCDTHSKAESFMAGTSEMNTTRWACSRRNVNVAASPFSQMLPCSVGAPG